MCILHMQSIVNMHSRLSLRPVIKGKMQRKLQILLKSTADACVYASKGTKTSLDFTAGETKDVVTSQGVMQQTEQRTVCHFNVHLLH